MRISASFPRVVVTGAGGFIGRHLTAELLARGYPVRALSTAANPSFPQAVEHCRLRTSAGEPVWADATHDMDVVIHLAGRAHVIQEQTEDPLAEFRRVNVRATVQLAEQAISSGARRFIFVSSIGVNGSVTWGRPFTEETPPAPSEPYAVSKWEAEQALREFARRSNLALTIVRLPLVYGAGAKGNFLRLLRLVDSAVPLPLASVKNLRSYVGVANVCDFLVRCVDNAAAVGRLFLLADGEDVSTPELIRAMAASMDRPVRLFRCPPSLIKAAAKLIGRSAEIDRLTSSLQVDAGNATRVLNWSAPVSFSAGIKSMSEWFTHAMR